MLAKLISNKRIKYLYDYVILRSLRTKPPVRPHFCFAFGKSCVWLSNRTLALLRSVFRYVLV